MDLPLRLFCRIVCVSFCLCGITRSELRHEAILVDQPGHTHPEQEAPRPSILMTSMAVTGSGASLPSAPNWSDGIPPTVSGTAAPAVSLKRI